MRSTASVAPHGIDPKTGLPTEIVPLRHPGRWAAAAFILFVAASLGYSAVTNERFEWPIVGSYLFHPAIMSGLRATLVLTAVSMTLAVILGIVLASCRMSENVVLKSLSAAYLWFFRGTPLLVQLTFLYYLSALYPRLSISVPFGGPEIVGANTNQVLSLWLVAIIGLTIHESAYMAEIVRGGLLSVSRTQIEAAAALGMNRRLTFTRVVLPQALRVIVPPTGNQVIGMLKYSSLVSTISLSELLYSARNIFSVTYETIPLLIVVSFWYLLCTTVLTYIQGKLERRYGRGVNRDLPKPRRSIVAQVRSRLSRPGVVAGQA